MKLVDDTTADLTVVCKAQTLMLELLQDCVLRPLDPEPMRAAFHMQAMLREDLESARDRLGITQDGGATWRS